MTIDEYKEAILDMVKEMEKEHGCDVDSMELEIDRPILSIAGTETKHYLLKFTMI